MSLTRYMKHCALTAAALGLGLHAVTSCAKEVSDTDPVWGDHTDVSVGAAAFYGPRYMGSDKYMTQLTPLISIERGIFFADSLRGVGVQYETDNGWGMSAALGYDAGRNDKKSSDRDGDKDLRGMGKIGHSTTLDLNLSKSLLPWLDVYGEAELRAAGEDRGNRYQLGLIATAFKSQVDNLDFDINAHAGDDKFNQTYFGVTEQQSARSRFTEYKADGGIYAYSAGLTWKHTFDPSLRAVTHLDITHYDDQAGNSPIVQRTTPASLSTALVYTF